MPEETPLKYLWMVWLLSSLSLIRVRINVLAHRSRMTAKLSMDRFETPRIIFQIATKSNIPIVQESIDPVIAV